MTELHLEEIPSTSDHRNQIEEHKVLFRNLFRKQDITALKEFINCMLSDTMKIVISRTVLENLPQKLANLPDTMQIQLSAHVLEKLELRMMAFEELNAKIRENLASIYQRQKRWLEAAQVLSGIPLESSQRILSTECKVSMYIQTANLYLQGYQEEEADRCLKKASALISTCTSMSLVMQYKLCSARIFEIKHKFLEAASRYYELSRILMNKDPDQTSSWPLSNQVLESAIICAVMAGAGPQRSTQLTTLYRDERSLKLEVYPILQKMVTHHILSKQEICAFVDFLKARTENILTKEDDFLSLQKAILEHNLLSASKIYLSIGFEELATLLDLSVEESERMAAIMISEERLQGYIDQLARFVHFQEPKPLPRWDHGIEMACTNVNQILDMISAKHPEFVDHISRDHLHD